MAGVTIMWWAGSDATDVPALSEGEVRLTGEVVSSSVGEPSDSDSRCFFDLGVDILKNQLGEQRPLHQIGGTYPVELVSTKDASRFEGLSLAIWQDFISSSSIISNL